MSVRRAQQGFSLVEVLVAFLVMAIGLLGVVKLQGIAQDSAVQANQRARAVALAESMIERVRSTPSAMASYVDTGTGLSPVLGLDGYSATSGCSNSGRISCGGNTEASFALFNLDRWHEELRGSLIQASGTQVGGLLEPAGQLAFTADTGLTNTGQLTVTVQWCSSALVAGSGTAALAGSTDCVGLDGIRQQVSVTTRVLDVAEL